MAKGRGRRTPRTVRDLRIDDRLRAGTTGPPSTPAHDLPPVHVRSLGWRSKAGMFAAGTAAAGGTAYLYHRRHSVNKSSLVEFRKAVSGPHGQNYPDALKGQAMIGRTRTAAGLVPTGRHVSHANDLVTVRRKRRSTAGATSLGHFGKAEPEPSRGRLNTGTAFGGIHSIAAGKKGHRTRAATRSTLYGLAGTAPGLAATAAAGAMAHRAPVAGAALMAGGVAGSYGGAFAGNRRAVRVNQRRGHYKAESQY